MSISVGSWVIEVSVIYIIHTIITLTDVLCRGKWSVVMCLSPGSGLLLKQYTSESIKNSYMSKGIPISVSYMYWRIHTGYNSEQLISSIVRLAHLFEFECRKIWVSENKKCGFLPNILIHQITEY